MADPISKGIGKAVARRIGALLDDPPKNLLPGPDPDEPTSSGDVFSSMMKEADDRERFRWHEESQGELPDATPDRGVVSWSAATDSSVGKAMVPEANRNVYPVGDFKGIHYAEGGTPVEGWAGNIETDGAEWRGDFALGSVEAIDAIPQEKGTVGQYLNQIRKAIGKDSEELAILGVDQIPPETKVTKDEFRRWLIATGNERLNVTRREAGGAGDPMFGLNTDVNWGGGYTFGNLDGTMGTIIINDEHGLFGTDVGSFNSARSYQAHLVPWFSGLTEGEKSELLDIAKRLDLTSDENDFVKFVNGDYEDIDGEIPAVVDELVTGIIDEFGEDHDLIKRAKYGLVTVDQFNGYQNMDLYSDPDRAHEIGVQWIEEHIGALVDDANDRGMQGTGGPHANPRWNLNQEGESGYFEDLVGFEENPVGAQFSNPHYHGDEGLNSIVHIRGKQMNVRTREGDVRALVAYEIQSDIHQSGADLGYNAPDSLSADFADWQRTMDDVAEFLKNNEELVRNFELIDDGDKVKFGIRTGVWGEDDYGRPAPKYMKYRFDVVAQMEALEGLVRYEFEETEGLFYAASDEVRYLTNLVDEGKRIEAKKKVKALGMKKRQLRDKHRQIKDLQIRLRGGTLETKAVRKDGTEFTKETRVRGADSAIHHLYGRATDAPMRGQSQHARLAIRAAMVRAVNNGDEYIMFTDSSASKSIWPSDPNSNLYDKTIPNVLGPLVKKLGGDPKVDIMPGNIPLSWVGDKGDLPPAVRQGIIEGHKSLTGSTGLVVRITPAMKEAILNDGKGPRLYSLGAPIAAGAAAAGAASQGEGNGEQSDR